MTRLSSVTTAGHPKITPIVRSIAHELVHGVSLCFGSIFSLLISGGPQATLSNSIEAILEEGSGSDGVFALYKIVDYPDRLRIQLDAGCVGPHDVSISYNQLHSRDVPLSAAEKHSRPL